MFINHNINTIKIQTKKIYVIIHIIVLFFSLNFNSILWVPNVTNANGRSDLTILEQGEESPQTLDIIDTSTIETMTGNIISITGISGVGENDEFSGSEATSGSEIDTDSLTGDSISQDIDQEIIQDDTSITDLTGINGFTEGDTDIGYFTNSFTKSEYDPKIFDLQNILKYIHLFNSEVNGIYDESTIEAIYQYQISHQLIDSIKDDSSLRGFFGPKTRAAFNKEYLAYKQALLKGVTQIEQYSHEEFSSARIDYTKYIDKVKSYFFKNKYNLEHIFGTGVFVGNEDIDFSILSGKIDLPLIFESSNTLDGNSAEVNFREGTVLKTDNGDVFTGNLESPAFLDISVAKEITGQKIVSVLDVGGNANTQILLEDIKGREITSKIKIPTPGQEAGTIVNVNYSHDGEHWFPMDNQMVFLEDGESYVEFETTHFTIFSIGLPIGSFFINNNNFSTNQIEVTLNSNVSGADYMRFTNDSGSLASASWVQYTTGYNRSLPAGDGYKTVYAQFSGTYGIQNIEDIILLDTTATGGNLKILLDGDIDGTNVLDASTNNNIFNGIGGLTNTMLDGDQVLGFNGTSQYAERNDIVGISGYPFTFSAWVNTSQLGTIQSILQIGNSSKTNVYYGIEISATGYPQIVGRNTNNYLGTSPVKISTGERYHIVGVFSSTTGRVIYVNGERMAHNYSAVMFSGDINPQIRVGRYVGTNTNYLSGYLDDVRIYNKALNLGEIQNLYNAREEKDLPMKYINDGEFLINSGESNTYTTGVTLISNVPGMTHMRFANDSGSLASAPWMEYTGFYSRYVDDTTGNKTVYAQFSGAGGLRNTQDNIFLDDVVDIDLKVLLDGTVQDTNAIDITMNGNNFGLSATTSTIVSGEKVFTFGAYGNMLRDGVGITSYPFTFSAWINTKSIFGTDTILMMGTSGSTTTYYGIQLISGNPSIVASNGTTTVTTNSSRILSTGQRYHIVGVFNSATNRTIYVNGELTSTSATTSVPYDNTNSQVRVGRYVGNATNYWDGYLDDIRVYNTALSEARIKTLYQNRTSRVEGPRAEVIYDIASSTVGPVTATLSGFSEPITIINNGGSPTYTFTKNGSFTFMFEDSDGNIGSTIAYVDRIDSVVGTTGSIEILGPSSLYLGSTGVSTKTSSIETLFSGPNDYFEVEDTLGSDQGYYTTLSFSDLKYGSYKIPKENIYIKTIDGIELIAGVNNSNVVSSIGQTYTNVSSPLTFIMRSSGSNNGKTGKYGSKIAVKVMIPPLQKPANYTGTIIYTLY